MSTAFDTVDHVTLLKKLELHGINVRTNRIVYDNKYFFFIEKKIVSYIYCVFESYESQSVSKSLSSKAELSTDMSMALDTVDHVTLLKVGVAWDKSQGKQNNL